MDLNTLVIDPEVAKRELAHYERQLASERTTEDEAIAAGYRAAARGLPVISLVDTFNAAGLHENGLPRLAIIRADAKECWCRHRDWNSTGWMFSDTNNFDNRGALVGLHTVRVPWVQHSGRWVTGRTIVPVIPPQHRPKKHRMRGFHILWEVEQWSMVAPVDPALLRHIRGDLWSVVATWDLTDLERAVLSQRARG